MTDKTSTEGLSPREATRWYLDQPEGTEFEARFPRSGWTNRGPRTIGDFVAEVESGTVYRIAPKPAAPERLWVTVDADGMPCNPVIASAFGTPGHTEYIRKDIAEAMVQKGRSLKPDLHVLPCGEQVLDRSTGLIWTRKTTAVDVNFDDGRNTAEACVVGGHKWQLPTRAELLTLVDDTRHDPAIDTDAFPDTKPSWYWARTELEHGGTAWSASCAWIVSFSSGSASYYPRDLHACVRAVRVARPEELIIDGDSHE